ncbi:MAG TPA: response regulator transcription factor [Saprospiraceae bacterium]|nr:response regulator transcription factor [Saprospiraceae bacterium]
MNYKIAIVDDHPVVRKGIKASLHIYKDVSIIFEASNGFELLELLKIHKVDVILLDVKMPKKSGYEALKEIRVSDKLIKILMFSVHEDAEYVSSMVQAEANGYLLKNADPEVIYDAITKVMSTGFYINETINPYILKNMLDQNSQGQEQKANSMNFSERELRVLTLLSEDKSTQEIADDIHVGIRSVEKIINEMQKRLDIHSRLGLVLYAIKNGLVKIKPEGM